MNGTAAGVPRLFEPVLRLFNAELTARLGRPHVEMASVSYENRPFSHVVRLRVDDEAGGRYYFVKIYKSKPEPADIDRMRARVSQDFGNTRRIADAMSGNTHFGVVRAVACFPEHLAIVTEQAEGLTLRQYLERYATWFPLAARRRRLTETVAAIGAWIRAFQSIDPPSGRVEELELREYVDLRLKRLVDCGAWSEADRRGVLQHLASLGEEIQANELERVLVHADMAPGNILVSEGRVTVLDLAMVQRGASLHDISRLFLQLDVLRAQPQFRPVVVEEIQGALLRGYDPALTADRPLFRYLLMLHRMNHLLTLTLQREAFPGALASWRVRRLHRHWIAGELRRRTVFAGAC